MSFFTIGLSLFSMFIGGFVTWLVARHYYIQALKGLKKEAEELRNLNNLMLRAMKEAGLAEFTHDSQGKFKGLVLKLSGKISAKSDASGKLTLLKKKNKHKITKASRC